jgi:tetratricopeptide (TPR) repeat protein
MSMNLSFPDFAKALEAYFSGDKARAREEFTRLAETHPDSASVFIMLGNVYYAQGILDEALANYQKATELEPSYGHAYYKFGVCAFRAGHLNQAREAFAKNLQLEGQSHVMSNYWIGLIDYFLGKDEGALEAFGRLKKESPDSNFANFFMAQLLIKHNRHQEALLLIEELVARTPDFVEAHYLLGQAYRGLYQNFEAIQCFRKALEIAPEDKRIQTELEILIEVPAP